MADRALRTLIFGAMRIPYETRVPLFGRLTRSVIAPAAGYRERALQNLAKTWPDMPAADRARIADEVCDNAGRTLIENYSGAEFRRRAAACTPTGPGLPVMAEARAAGRPIMIVTAHFGNYEAARTALVAQGYDIGGIYREMRNSFFNEHYARTMAGFGGPMFPQGRAGTAGFVRHLRSGGVGGILLDQHVSQGEYYDFLGRPARTSTSAADIALRLGAVLLPVYGTRRHDGLTFDVEVEAPVAHTDARTMTQALNDSLAARVRAHPGQWFWIHRRWK
jgi:KDO2-lipid IV(A) lauroyltransferase